jgi:hypothetical protein
MPPWSWLCFPALAAGLFAAMAGTSHPGTFAFLNESASATAQGAVAIRVNQTYRLQDAAQAHRDLERLRLDADPDHHAGVLLM